MTMGDMIGDVREVARLSIEGRLNAEWKRQHPNMPPPRWPDAGSLRVDHTLVDALALAVAGAVVRKLVSTWLLTEDEANELRGYVPPGRLEAAIERVVGSAAAGARPDANARVIDLVRRVAAEWTRRSNELGRVMRAGYPNSLDSLIDELVLAVAEVAP